MQIHSVAASAACALLCLTLGGSSARADAVPEVDRADAIAEAAHVTAQRLRRKWDDARKANTTKATCLADKVAQAVVLAKTIDDRRAELRATSEPASRARLAKRLEILEERRVTLEGEALRCK